MGESRKHPSAGLAPSLGAADLPGLRKTQATLTGLRFTREKETDTDEQKRSPGTEERSQASLFSSPGCYSPGLVAGAGPLYVFSPTALISPNSTFPDEFPPPTPRLPAPNRRASSDNQSYAETRYQAPNPGARLGE
ncbi:hypothetical protein mRhiFer1_008941 [Rhinolophus ferrumequinum]|uniref:Uncharacterized protein n=1 Tax=Rhinolophus ferrumequinum TaxID=59479 RepID=A0A7J7TEC8_RHIFE|nr:hypothetical protein mRhiFer1_008941 [Rhinolophus ferrumequinum]